MSNTEPIKPPPVETTPFKLVEDVKDLKELVAKLHEVNEFAVDLEHNQYRSFQGLTCLMQISTRAEDFIVDTLKLRVHIGPYLRDIFKDPTKRKVMHGAHKDILWLQRDFGIYVCNMFDTGQASRVLKMERNRLDYLLIYFCGVAANKEYQTADWRLRPLTDEMLRYAREDTHYLLFVYDLMKKRLLSSSTDPNQPDALLIEVFQRSYDVCMQMYEKDLLTEHSYLNIYGLHEADLNGQQLSVVASLCEWRDIVARAEDESTGYVLPNKILIEIAKKMPITNEGLRGLLTSNHPHIERNLTSIVSIVHNSMYNAAEFEGVARRLKEEYMEMKWFEEVSASSDANIAGNQSGKKAGSVVAGVNWNIPMNMGDLNCVGNAAGNRKLDLDTKLSSSFPMCLQTLNGRIMMKQTEERSNGSLEGVPFSYAAARKEDNDDGTKVIPENWMMTKSAGGCKDGGGGRPKPRPGLVTDIVNRV